MNTSGQIRRGMVCWGRGILKIMKTYIDIVSVIKSFFTCS